MPARFLLLLLLLPPSPWPYGGAAAAGEVEDDELLGVSMEMDPSEKETLFQIMESMSDDRDWRSSSPEPCNPGEGWPGIECKPAAIDGRMHVSRLDFGGSGGPLCRKGAAFPSRVFFLPYLQSLFFISCFSSGAGANLTTTLSFPPAAAPAPPLQQLSLRSNPSLVGAIPARIAALSATLQVLTLSQNRLSGEIPGEISSLKKLVHLDLSYNSLSGEIPSELGGGLRRLIGLDLSFNSLSGPIPASIGRLGLLQKLDLSSNSISGAVPESFSGLRSLSFLALSGNRISGDLPGGFAELRSLQYFIMEGNSDPISARAELPTQLGRLVRLRELRLAGSGYGGPIPASLESMENLTTLSLENNRFTGGIPAAIGGLGRIYHLNLSRNLLSGEVPFDVEFVRRLGRNLDLSGNSGLCFVAEEEAKAAGVEVCGGVVGANGSSSALLRPRRSAGAHHPASFFSDAAVVSLLALLMNLYMIIN